MDSFGNIFYKSESDVLIMQILLDGIRKIVVLVLLMELVVQMQPGKSYEPYIKMLVGIMVVYSIVSGICSTFSANMSFKMPPMQEFVWNNDWNAGEADVVKNSIGKSGEIVLKIEEVQVEQIVIDKIRIEEMKTKGGTP